MNLLIYGSSYIIFQSIVGKEQKTKLRSSNTGSILDNNISKSFILT